MDAFTELLEGGFGMHEVDEPIKITWSNMKKSRDNLPASFFDSLDDIFASAENVTYERKEFK